MLLSETEAKNKWCVHSRQTLAKRDKDTKSLTVTPDTPTYNNLYDTVENKVHRERCIGSGCMAWRWGEEGRTIEAMDVALNTDGPRKGYCGAFGKPEFND